MPKPTEAKFKGLGLDIYEEGRFPISDRGVEIRNFDALVEAALDMQRERGIPYKVRILDDRVEMIPTHMRGTYSAQVSQLDSQGPFTTVEIPQSYRDAVNGDHRSLFGLRKAVGSQGTETWTAHLKRGITNPGEIITRNLYLSVGQKITDGPTQEYVILARNGPQSHVEQIGEIVSPPFDPDQIPVIIHHGHDANRVVAANQEGLVEIHRRDLYFGGLSMGLGSLTHRLEMGLDPAGMLAVSDTWNIIEKVLGEYYEIVHKNQREQLEDALLSLEDQRRLQMAGPGRSFLAQYLFHITADMHQGGQWDYADQIRAATNPAILAWLWLASAAKKSGGDARGLTPRQYADKFEIVRRELRETTIDQAVEYMQNPANFQTFREEARREVAIYFAEVEKGGWALDEAALYGYSVGVQQGIGCSGETEFIIGAKELNYEQFAQDNGLTSRPIEGTNGRMVEYFNNKQEVVIKQVYPGLAIAWDKDIALELASYQVQRNSSG